MAIKKIMQMIGPLTKMGKWIQSSPLFPIKMVYTWLINNKAKSKIQKIKNNLLKKTPDNIETKP